MKKGKPGTVVDDRGKNRIGGPGGNVQCPPIIRNGQKKAKMRLYQNGNGSCHDRKGTEGSRQKGQKKPSTKPAREETRNASVVLKLKRV